MPTYLLFSHRFYPQRGGVESFTKNLANALVEDGNRVCVITSKIGKVEEFEILENGVEIFRVPCYSLLSGRLPLSKHGGQFRRLLNEAADKKPDRVLVNTRLFPLSIDGLEFAKSLNIPAVVLDHGSAHLTFGNAFVDTFVERYEHLITKKVKSYGPVFAGISEKSVRWLGHFGIETEYVIPNAIDAEAYRRIASDRDFHEEAGSSKIVAYVGRLAPEKGCNELLKAARSFESNGSIKFLLAGDGMLRKSLEEKAPRNVMLLGALDQSDISSLLQQSSVFCLPSRSEGFCTSLLEAGACGVPSIITDVGGATELIPEPSVGWILPSGESGALVNALNNCLNLPDGDRRQMGRRAQKIVESEYNWKKSVAALEAVYDQF